MVRLSLPSCFKTKADTDGGHDVATQCDEAVSFGGKVLSGGVTALVTYDMIHTMEIAEEAIENSNDDRCIEAAEVIERCIVQGM